MAWLAFFGTEGPASGQEFLSPRDSFYETAKLLASDGGRFDHFGGAVAVSGDTAIVGAQNWFFSKGAVYVYRRDAGGAEGWAEVAMLTRGEDHEIGDVGKTLAIHGDTILVGADRAVLVFQRSGPSEDVWNQVAKLDYDPSHFIGGLFADAVSLSGDTAVAGAAGEDDRCDNCGAVYVFHRHAGGPDSWGQVARLTAPDRAPLDGFGGAVAVSGDTMVVGAAGDDDLGNLAGSAYIYQRDPAGDSAWRLMTKIFAKDGGPEDRFAESAAIDGDTVVLGAFRDSEAGVYSGSAYVFERNAEGPGAWGQVAKLRAADETEDDRFGFFVAIDEDRIVVGAEGDDDVGDYSGSAYVFERNAGGPSAWGQVAKITPSDGKNSAKFGHSVAIDSDTVVVGAERSDEQENEQGAAYVYLSTTVDPALAVSGVCPEEVSFAASGMTPKGRVALYGALSEGSDQLGGGPCKGTVVGLEPVLTLGRFWADEWGDVSGVRQVPEPACNAFYQAVDLTSCATSNVEPSP